uniref:FBD domain-containing protein n=1 Tax=Romanomermis culicivorax TaxID=13658 RepID=A0A915HLS4_ROMCU
MDADFDEYLPYHTVIKDLHFVSLQNIEVFCGNFESHAKFVAFLLSHSPLLKQLSLRPSH